MTPVLRSPALSAGERARRRVTDVACGTTGDAGAAGAADGTGHLTVRHAGQSVTPFGYDAY